VAIHKLRTTYDPQSLKAIGRAFDEAWIEIAGNFGGDPAAMRAGRLKLADALLTAADEGNDDVEALKQAALKLLASAYRKSRLH
jgi:hypothetical protein